MTTKTKIKTGEGTALPVQWARLSDLVPHPQNPRDLVTEGPEWDAFLESILSHGVLQPLLVRPAPSGEGFEVVGGHRRLAAASAAGLDQVPVMVKPLTNREALEILLIENLERSDLNAMEESSGVCALVTDGGATREEVAAMLHRSADWVQLRLDLPLLPDDAKTAVRTGQLSLGVAREVLAVPIDERERAIQLVLYPEFDSEPLSLRKARLVLEEEVWHWRRLHEQWAAMAGDARRQFPMCDPIANLRDLDDIVYFHGALRHPYGTADSSVGLAVERADGPEAWVSRPLSVFAERLEVRGISYPVTDDDGKIVRIAAAIDHAEVRARGQAVVAASRESGEPLPDWLLEMIREDVLSRAPAENEDVDEKGPAEPAKEWTAPVLPLPERWQRDLAGFASDMTEPLWLYDVAEEDQSEVQTKLVAQRAAWLAWLHEGRERMDQWLPPAVAEYLTERMDNLRELARELDQAAQPEG